MITILLSVYLTIAIAWFCNMMQAWAHDDIARRVIPSFIGAIALALFFSALWPVMTVWALLT